MGRSVHLPAHVEAIVAMPTLSSIRSRARAGGVVLLSLSATLAVPSAASAGPPGVGPIVDCRYERPVGEARETGGDLAFPEDDLFTAPIAAPKEPRFTFSYRRVHFRETPLPSGGAQDVIDAGVVSAGGTFGLWAHRVPEGCDGLQASLIAGVFSQFNLDAPSRDLINSDFVVGAATTFRHGAVSARLRFYHQSSHLGDEFVLRNPSIVRTDFGFQGVDGLLSYDGAWWRLYGGGGYLAFTTDGLDPGMLQGGAELGATDTRGGRLGPVFGIDLSSLQARGWGTTTSASAGVAWASAAGSRRMRLLFVFLEGFIPFGQFSVRQKLSNTGLQLQIDF